VSAPVNAFVLDCSIAVSWLVADETSAKTDRLLERLRDDGALVPALWHLELGNVLARAKNHERITTAQIAAIVELVNRLSITADTDHSRALKEVLSLARAESIPDHLLTPPIWNSPCGTESRWRRWTRRWSRRPTESLRSRTQRASTADSCIASR